MRYVKHRRRQSSIRVTFGIAEVAACNAEHFLIVEYIMAVEQSVTCAGSGFLFRVIHSTCICCFCACESYMRGLLLVNLLFVKKQF